MNILPKVIQEEDLKNVEIVSHIINLRIQSPEVTESGGCGLMAQLPELGCNH